MKTKPFQLHVTARAICCVAAIIMTIAVIFSAETASAQSRDEPFSTSWQLLGNHFENDSAFYAAIKITNNGAEVLGNSGWAFYFNRYPSAILTESVRGDVKMERISGGFFRITPTENFTPLKKGDTATILYGSYHPLVKSANGANGGYFLIDGSQEAIETETQRLAPAVDVITLTGNQDWIVTPEQRYHTNDRITQAGVSACPITPTPRSFTKGNGHFALTNQTVLRCPESLGTLAAQFQGELNNATGVEIQLSTDAVAARKPIFRSIELYLDENAAAESYELVVNDGGIKISGDAAGVFYATRSLISLANSNADATQIPSCTIKDAPRFAYRGFHIDVARNFHCKASLLQIIDKISDLKLNKLHLHLCDDEGWRVEIAGLPELTEVGGRRGHTTDEADRLYPAYGSGPNIEPNSAGSGFYSREDFVEILKYATQRHVEVIPELDFPGHARAAIVAMKRRYDRLMMAGDENGANEFLLTDPDDQSEYWSIQYYNDNVVCAAQPGVFRFFAKVVDELRAMYAGAEAKLRVVHTGGDEVPAGVWEKSPMCQKYIEENDHVQDVAELSYDFLSKLSDVLQQRNIQLAGWEEIALKRDPEHEQNKKLPNPDFVDQNFIPYIWNSVVDWKGEELGYKLANAGYPVVLCNADHLYLSLSAAIDVDEPGYFWAGIVTPKTIFEFTPLDIYKVTRTQRNGKFVDRAERFASATRLTDAGRRNVLGIQGQIWSETLRTKALLEDRVYRNLLALAERAWAPQPDWAKEDDLAKLDAGLDEAYARFSNRVDRYELPLLTKEKIGFHLPQPGVIESEGKLFANVQYPNALKVRYTTDGTEPTASSPEFDSQIEAKPGKYRFASFSTDGRSSRAVTIEIKP